jgi:hypothetical protein
MAASADDLLTTTLHPGERMLSKHAALLHGHFNFNKDVLCLTNERLLLVVKDKKTYNLGNSWNLEDLPPIHFQRQSKYATTLIVAGTKIYLKDMNADSVGAAIEGAKNNRRQALLAAAPPPPAPAPTVVRERETIREIVKVPCRYCNQLNLMNSAKCSGCGAPLG